MTVLFAAVLAELSLGRDNALLFFRRFRVPLLQWLPVVCPVVVTCGAQAAVQADSPWLCWLVVAFFALLWFLRIVVLRPDYTHEAVPLSTPYELLRPCCYLALNVLLVLPVDYVAFLLVSFVFAVVDFAACLVIFHNLSEEAEYATLAVRMFSILVIMVRFL